MAILSLIAALVSVLGVVLYGAMFEVLELKTLFIIVTVASMILPVVAKKVRVMKNKNGKVLEILAIVLAGLNFYFVIFALSTLPIFVGYLGWVAVGVAYWAIKEA